MKNQVIEHNAGLSAEALEGLRESLEEQRRFRHEQLRQLTASETGSQAGSRAGSPTGPRAGFQADSQAEVRHQIADSARMVLADVEAALERMDHGRYGTCHRCARRLLPGHLRVVPQARYCFGCHRARAGGE